MNKNYRKVYQIIILLLLLFNGYLAYLLKTQDQIDNSAKESNNGFYVNGLETKAISNADYNKKTGYMVNVKDTILINQHLCISYLLTEDSSTVPQNYLYELNEVDSTFILLNKKTYNNDGHFEYIQRSFQTKLLFLRTKFPEDINIGSLASVIIIKARDSDGVLSSDISEEKIHYFFERFFTNEEGDLSN